MPSIKINSYLKKATAFAGALSERVPLTTVVIDNWRGAIRLIYGGPNNPRCPSSCGQCSLFRDVGVDDPALIDRNEEDERKLHVVTTLAKPDVPDDFKLNANVRRFVNCMSLAQYASFYTAWLVQKCESEDEVLKELELVEGMRIVYHRGVHDLSGLECAVKRLIVENALWQLPENNWKIPLVIKHATRLGLI